MKLSPAEIALARSAQEYYVGGMPQELGSSRRAQLRQRRGMVNPAVIVGGEFEEAGNWVVNDSQRTAAALKVPMANRWPGTTAWHYFARQALGFMAAPVVNRRIKKGKLPPLNHGEWAVEGRRIFDDQEASRSSGAVYSRGIPTPRGQMWFSGVVSVEKNLAAFEARTIAAIKKIVAEAPGTLIQFELPLELTLAVLQHKKYPQLYQYFVKAMKSIDRVIRAADPDKKCLYAFHMCWADLEGQPVVPKFRQFTQAKIALLNAISGMKLWAEGWTLYAVHEPWADGKHAPKATNSVLKLYKKYLKPLPAGTIYVLGIVQGSIDTERVVGLARLIIPVLAEKGVKRLGIAYFCGLSRCAPDKKDGKKKTDPAKAGRCIDMAQEAVRRLRATTR